MGDYTVSTEPGAVYRAGLELFQRGEDVRGQLITDRFRTARVSLTVDGSTLTGEFEYTDDCTGWAQVSASVREGGERIAGTYSASDCSGEYTGTLDVVRLTGNPTPPIVAITAPQHGAIFREGTPITFEGTGDDLDGGGVTLVWRSNRQGILGTGSRLISDRLSAGGHTISLIAIDDEMQVRTASIPLNISATLTGTYVGVYIVSSEPDTHYAAAFELVQSGKRVGGELRIGTEVPRTASVFFTIEDATLRGRLDFTDNCVGSAELSASILYGAYGVERIVGSFSASDCGGEYTGRFDASKYRGQPSPPTIAIHEPPMGAIIPVNTLITFRAVGYDPDGGSVSLNWHSTIDGDLGTGSPIYRDDLSVGAHTIELLGIDDEAQIERKLTYIEVAYPIVWPLSPSLDFHGRSSTETPDADDLDLATEFTIELWIKPGNVGDEAHLVSKWGNHDEAAYQVALESGRLRFGTRNAPIGGNTFAVTNSRLVPRVWQHVAVVFDNGEARLYLDGLLDSAQQGIHVPQATRQTLSLGRERSRTHNPKFYLGLMDEVRIWKVARTADEIANNMTVSLTGSEPGVVAYWPMNEGAGDTAFDLTANGHHMRLGDEVGPDNADPAWLLPDML
jgi:hypothetical protein